MRLLVTGGTGVIGRALACSPEAREHELRMPTHAELDLFDDSAVLAAARGADGIVHLATRIPSAARASDPGAWHENDRLRAEASRILVDAAITAGASVYVQPTVTFIYPTGQCATESTPIEGVLSHLSSALVAEREAARFAARGGRGVVLRFGLLDGPGTGNNAPNGRFGATLHVMDAASALIAALTIPSGTYNVCRDAEAVSNARFRAATGWRARR